MVELVIAAVLLGDLKRLVNAEVEVIHRLRKLQAVDYMWEALRLRIERGHHVVHEAGREIAVIDEVRVIVIVRQRRKLLVHLARLLIRAEVAEHKVGIVIVGIDKDALLRLGKRDALYVGLLRQFAVMLPLGKYHHQRHLVHAGAVVPRVGIIKPRFARGEICIGDAEPLRPDTVA